MKRKILVHIYRASKLIKWTRLLGNTAYKKERITFDGRTFHITGLYLQYIRVVKKKIYQGLLRKGGWIRAVYREGGPFPYIFIEKSPPIID